MLQRELALNQGDLQTSLHELINFHYSSLVTAPVAVVRSREDCQNALVMVPVVAFHDQLMGSGDVLEVILVAKLF